MFYGFKKKLIRCAKQMFPRLMLRLTHDRMLRKAEKMQFLSEEDVVQRIKERYRLHCGTELNLDSPVGYNEKIQWRKIYDRNLIYSYLSDKYAVREWVEKKIGEEYLIPLLGMWDDEKNIDFDALPDQFVLKTNNASSTNTIVLDKSKIDKYTIKENYRFWLKFPFAYKSMELHYNAIKPKIIAEKYLQPDSLSGDIKDYKFLCFNGKPCYIWVDLDRYHGHKRKVYSLDWVAESWTIGPYGFCEEEVDKPKNLNEMIALVEKLAEGFAHVRVDMYEVGGKVYFGEMTFTSSSGEEVFTPSEWDNKIGALWDIEKPQVDEKLVDCNI